MRASGCDSLNKRKKGWQVKEKDVEIEVPWRTGVLGMPIALERTE